MQALWDKLEREPIEPSAGTNAARAKGAPARLAAGQALTSLANETLADRFRHWRGASGRRYIFSLYEPESCPAYDDAVLMVVLKAADGVRRIAAICDTGNLPDLALSRACEAAAAPAETAECHIHLLAGSRAERAAVIEDLLSAATGDSER
jgi:hypothetical protein